MKKLRLAFMGTPDFAVAALAALVAAGHDVVCVYAQPPRPAGRGHKLHPSPVQTYAESMGIPVRSPKSLKKDADARAEFAALNLDVAIVAAYGLILPQEVLGAPKYGCINIHASLLPRWRGAAPIQRAIMAGDVETGICIMQMDAGLDTGAVLLSASTPITDSTTAQALHDMLAGMGADLIVAALKEIETLGSTTQPAEGATYAHMLEKEEGRIDWSKPAKEIARQVRAFHPWPGVWCMHNDQRLKVLEAEAVSHSGTPGEIIDRRLIVACGQGALLLKMIQPQGKNPMDGASFMNGARAKVGDMLS